MKFNLNKQSLYELWMENKNKVRLIFIILIIILIAPFFIRITPTINYQSLENDVISIVKNYIKDNNISINNQTYIDLLLLENNGYSIPQEINKKCKLGSGILVKPIDTTLEYIPYLMCDKYQSTTIATINNNESPNFKLLGDKIVFLSQTEDYLDPGYELTNEVAVEVRGNIDNKPGLYVLNYLIHEGNNITESLNRIVVVTSYSDYLEDNDLFMSLIGENGVTITQGDNYIDPGATAIDNRDGNITRKIMVSNSVNTNKPGSYVVKYDIVNSLGKKVSLERVVNVIPKKSNLIVTSSIFPSTNTNQDVSIKVNISGNDYDKTLLPNRSFTYSKSINYKVSNNGIYTFKIYTKDGNYETKSITVSNIDKVSPHGTCSGRIKSGKTTLTVKSNDNNINSYIYKTGFSNSPKVNTSTYTFDSELKYASVNIYDNAGNLVNIICQLTNDNPTTPTIPLPSDPTKPGEPYTPPATVNPGTLTQNSFMTTKYGTYKFWLYIPKSATSNNATPLVIFLHGKGESGTNLNSLTSVGLMKYLKEGYQYDAIIAAPQIPENTSWNSRISVVKDLIDYLITNYNIDQDRISISGHSLGAMGAYTFAAKYPDLLSCIAPLSGRASTNLAPALVNTPILAYHGDKDRGVPYSVDKSLINAVKKLGGNATLITLEGKGHNIANIVFQKPDLINWMISQKR